MRSDERPVKDAERARLEEARKLIQTDFKWVSVRDLAAHVHLSLFHFLRRFKLAFGMTPKQALAARQIEAAKAKMLVGGQTLEQIAEDTGFSHVSHFITRFKQLVGMPPRAWLTRERTLLRKTA